MLRVFMSLVLAAGLSLPLAKNAGAAQLIAKIDLSDQRLYLYRNGPRTASWKVSTARRGYRTPTGRFRPQRMYKRYFSRKYNNSPMPHSVFFYHGYAIHGTNYVKNLGRPASHGCIRLHPRNARQFYSLIRQYGAKNTRIVIRR